VHPAAFLSPLDYQLVSLSIAARLVLYHVRSRDYFDPEASLLPELQRMARCIGSVVPLFRLRKNGQVMPLPASEAAGVDATDLDDCAVRRGDLRTALLRLGNGCGD
jgi:hypothetical protein